MSLILAVDVAASVACCGVAVLPRAGVATTTATASWYVMDRQDVEVVILVVLVGVAPACCLLLAVVLQLDLGMLLLFFSEMEMQLLPRGAGGKDGAFLY